jgi:hypothetical protein
VKAKKKKVPTRKPIMVEPMQPAETTPPPMPETPPPVPTPEQPPAEESQASSSESGQTPSS